MAEDDNNERSIEERRLRLEREKFEHERQRQTREDSSILKRGTTLVTIGAGMVAAVISVSQFLIQRDKARLDQVLEKEKSERDWKLQAVRLVMENDKKLFSSDQKERASAIAIIKTALPLDLYNNILGQAAAQSATAEARDQFRTAQDLSLAEGKRPTSTEATPRPSASTERLTPAVRFNVEAVQQATKGYRFSIGVIPDVETKGKIERVEYVVNHPSFKTKNYSSSESKSNFSMSYVGWGAVDEVSAVVHLKGGDTQVATINMIRELGW